MWLGHMICVLLVFGELFPLVSIVTTPIYPLYSSLGRFSFPRFFSAFSVVICFLNKGHSYRGGTKAQCVALICIPLIAKGVKSFSEKDVLAICVSSFEDSLLNSTTHFEIFLHLPSYLHVCGRWGAVHATICV